MWSRFYGFLPMKAAKGTKGLKETKGTQRT